MEPSNWRASFLQDVSIHWTDFYLYKFLFSNSDYYHPSHQHNQSV